MQLAREPQGVGDRRAHLGDRRQLEPRQLMVQERDVEGRVVYDELGTRDVGEKLGGDLREFRLVEQELVLRDMTVRCLAV